jgi:hypothetical protein
VMVLGRERDVGVRMMYGPQDLIANGGMFVKLGRLFCVNAIRRVDDLTLDRQLADVMEVAGDSRAST